MFSVDETLSIDVLSTQLATILPSFKNVFMDLPKQTLPKQRSLFRSLSSPTLSDVDAALTNLSLPRIYSLSREVRHLRKFKSPAEVAVMRSASDLSGHAHAKVRRSYCTTSFNDSWITVQTMRFTKPGVSEGALAAHFEYLCALKGSERPAYVPVVASGSNALVIHYTANDRMIRDTDLVLMDAGCELQLVPQDSRLLALMRNLQRLCVRYKFVRSNSSPKRLRCNNRLRYQFR